jgi:hypothetical protein
LSITVNSYLGPRFKLSKVDIEDIQNSSVIKAGDWNSKLTIDLLKDFKKKDRRGYYKLRVNEIGKKLHK